MKDKRLLLSSVVILISLTVFGCQREDLSSELTYFESWSSASPEKQTLVRIPHDQIKKLATLGIEFSVEDRSHEEQVVGYIDAVQLRALTGELQEATIPLDPWRWAIGGYERSSFRELDIPDRKTMYEGYHDHQELTEELQRLADTYSNIVEMRSLGESVRGVNIPYLVISDNPTMDEAEPKFVYHANIHGDEVVGRELMIYLARHFTSEYGQDERITQLVDHSQIFILPVLNPDGFDLGRRSNANGYDLNRNFPDQFTSPSDTTEGRQKEVALFMELAAEHHFVYGISWHGGEICFNLPWGNIRNTSANLYWDDAMFYDIGREYTLLNQPMYNRHYSNFDHGLTYGYEWYPVNGGQNDWMNLYRRSIHAVVELSRNKWPSSRYLSDYWDNNREAMLTFLWRGLRGLHLEVRDENNQLLQNTTITIESAPGREMLFDGGFINRLTGEGRQRAIVTVEGYQPTTVELEPWYFAGDYQKVILSESAVRE